MKEARRAVLVLLLLVPLLPLDHCRDVPMLPEKSSNAGPDSIEYGIKFAACYPTNCDTGVQCFCCKFYPGSACYPTEGECRDHCIRLHP
ncbi:hypothetical protein OPV22_023506 [Ensete ventricosum]|nr:hypothetical protein OPV22_023506 [Ensete ventricosum]RZS13521.1 hypothetical protein BHM03_00045124 [Ensete ventricosum]